MTSFPLPSPIVTIHLAAAVGALLLGPIALSMRKTSRLHRGLGYAWITLMVGAAISSFFIRGGGLPNIHGYSPIHLLSVAVFFGIGAALYAIARGDVRAHQRRMWITYAAGSLVAGAFALLPSRYLGQLLWGQVLGLV